MEMFICIVLARELIYSRTCFLSCFFFYRADKLVNIMVNVSQKICSKISGPGDLEGLNVFSGKHIALLIHDLRGGGAERVTVSLANGFASFGLKVDLVMINKEGNESFFDSLSPMVRIIELRQRRTLTSIFGFRNYFNTYQPDVVVSAMTHINVAAILANLMSSRPTRLIVVEHNQISKNKITKSSLVRLAYRLVPWVYRYATKIGAVSEGVKTDLVFSTGLPSEKIDVLYNPVVTPDLVIQSKEEINHPWFAQGQPPVILGVGRLTEQKSFDTLIEAFALIRSKQAARLVLLGEGPDRAALQEKARLSGWQNDIAFLGFVGNPFAYMQRAAIFALTSKWEGLPTSLIEAMACGTPVIATDCPSGPAEILRNGRTCPLVPVGDAQAIANALLESLARPTAKEVLLKRAEDFSLERAVEGYLSAAFPLEMSDGSTKRHYEGQFSKSAA